MVEFNKTFRILVKAAIFCLIAFFIEIGICNFRTWESISWNPSDLIAMDAFLLKDGQYTSFNDNTSIIAPFREDGWCDVTAYSGNMHVKNVYLLCRYLDSSNQPIDNSFVTVYMKIRDEGNELSYQAPDRVIVPEITRTQYNRLNPSGNLKGLELTFLKPDYKDVCAVEIQKCVFNKTVPIHISGIRFIILLSLILCVSYLCPGSSIYQIQFGQDFPGKKLAVSMCMIICMAIPLFFANIDPKYNYKNYRTQYHDLTEALLNGHTYLDEVPSKTLIEMDNPYDAWLRDKIMRDSGESWRLDWAYYNEKYYVYFGVVPVLFNFLPYYMLTGTHLSVSHSVCFFGIFYILGCFMLLWLVYKRNFKEVPFVIYLLSCVMLVFCSGMFYAFRYPSFYGLPIIAAAALAMWGLWFWYGATENIQQNFHWIRVMLGSLCIALIAGCRPQFLIVSIASLIIFSEYLFCKSMTGRGYGLNKRFLFSKRGITFLIVWIMPVLIVAIFIMYYNFIRFDSPFDFGANYNLTSNDMTHRGWHWDRTVLGLFIYLFDPTKVSGVFPFILDSITPSASAIRYTNYMGITIVEGPYGGIIFNHPILIMSFLPTKLRKYCEKEIYQLILFFVISAIIVVVVDTQMAGLVGRYLMDFGWMLCLATALLYSSVEKFSNDSTLKIFIRTGILISVIWGLIYEVLLAFNGAMRASLPNLYYKFQTAVEFWL